MAVKTPDGVYNRFTMRLSSKHGNRANYLMEEIDESLKRAKCRNQVEAVRPTLGRGYDKEEAQEYVSTWKSHDFDYADLSKPAARIMYRKYLRRRGIKFRACNYDGCHQSRFRQYLRYLGTTETMLEWADQRREDARPQEYTAEQRKMYKHEGMRVNAESDNTSGGLFESEGKKWRMGKTHPKRNFLKFALVTKLHRREGKPWFTQFYPLIVNGEQVGFKREFKVMTNWRDFRKWVPAIRVLNEVKEPRGLYNRGILVQDQEWRNGGYVLNADRMYVLRQFTWAWYNDRLTDAVDPNGVHYRWGIFRNPKTGVQFVLTCPVDMRTAEYLERDAKKPGLFRGVVQFKDTVQLDGKTIAGTLVGPYGDWFDNKLEQMLRQNWMPGPITFTENGHCKVRLTRDLVVIKPKIYRELPEGGVQKFEGYRLKDYSLLGEMLEAHERRADLRLRGMSTRALLPDCRKAVGLWRHEWSDMASRSMDDFIQWCKEQSWWDTKAYRKVITKDEVNTAGVRYVWMEVELKAKKDEAKAKSKKVPESTYDEVPAF